VIGLFLLLAVIVAMRQHIVIVVVGVPVRPVLPLVQRVARVVMRDMEVVVTVRSSWVGVRRLFPFTLCVLKFASA
jgi:hypothetical protein